MTQISYGPDRYPLAAHQSVLDCLHQHGVPVPFSCRVGICQTCLLRATAGTPPAAAQQGLHDSLKAQHYFLACVCQPTADLTVALPDAAAASITAVVCGREHLNGEIIRLELACASALDYRAGQCVNVLHQGHSRSYSLASVPGLDQHLQLHVRRVPHGRVSGWLHDGAQLGQVLTLRGPHGNCLYLPGRPQQPLLLIGTGSGLAPLYGIVRDALQQGHCGPVRLFHGSRTAEGLYLVAELQALQRQYPQFQYVPCVSGSTPPPGCAAGRADALALQAWPDLRGWRVFLCGHPEMVRTAKKQAFLAGAALQDLYADAFTHAVAAPASVGA